MSQSSAIAATSKGEQWALRELGKETKNTCHLAAIRLQSLLKLKLSMWKQRILAPGSWGSWGAYQRNDVSEPRLLHLPMHRKSAKFLNLRYHFLLLSVIFCSYNVPFVAKLLYILTPPSPPWSSSVRVTWDAASRAWSPQYVHQIKHNSQLLGHAFFSLDNTNLKC